MSPTRISSARAIATVRAVPTTALAVVLASATLAPTFLAPPQTRAMLDIHDATYVYTDEALPGDGRPPSPGPTDPSGAM